MTSSVVPVSIKRGEKSGCAITTAPTFEAWLAEHQQARADENCDDAPLQVAHVKDVPAPLLYGHQNIEQVMGAHPVCQALPVDSVCRVKAGENVEDLEMHSPSVSSLSNKKKR